MKQLLLSVLLVASTFAVRAQKVINNTSCDIKVTQICYTVPSCTPGVNWTITVPPGGSVLMPAQCPFPKQTAYKVCWVNTPCTPTFCTMVDGTIPLGTCSGVPYVNTMGPCDLCSSNNGIGTVTFDPTTRNLIVTP